MLSIDLGIDLGTASILVYVSGRGIVLKEPTVAVVDKNTGEIRAAGEEALQMYGRTPENMKAVRPMRQGVISDPEVTVELLRYFIRKGQGRRILRKPKICICVPAGSTSLERNALEDAIMQVGARSVTIIEAPIAAALGAGIDISKPCGNMVVDIGSGTADIAVISMGGTVVGTTVKVAGDNFNDEIVRYMKKNHNLLIGDRTAEELKVRLGCAHPRPELVILDVSGRNLETGLPMSVTVTSDEMLDALSEASMAIVESIKDVLQRTPPELASDIQDRGIVLTGGGSLLSGLDQLIEEKTGINTMIAESPMHCVALGTGRFLEKMREK